MTTNDDEKPAFSIIAYIEQMAKMLRQAARPPKPKERDYSKEASIGPKNRIERIARMLRNEAKKK